MSDLSQEASHQLLQNRHYIFNPSESPVCSVKRNVHICLVSELCESNAIAPMKPVCDDANGTSVGVVAIDLIGD